MKFYADYCGHCKKLAPVFKEVSEEVENVVFGEIECPSHRLVCGKYGIKGFPTLLLFKDNEKYEYEGPRTELNIINWLNLFDKPLFIRDSQLNLTEIAQNYSFDHYYILKINNCDNVEKDLNSLKGQSTIYCENINENKEEMSVVFFNKNKTYTMQNDEETPFSSVKIQKFVLYYNLQLYQRVNILGGIIFSYIKHNKQSVQVETIMKQLGEKQDRKAHYGVMFHEGQFSERIIKQQLQLDKNQNQIIYFDTQKSPFKLYSMELDLDSDFQEQYDKFINNLEQYEKPYNPVVQPKIQQEKHKEYRTVLMILALSLIIITLTTICLCEYHDNKEYERQQKLIEKSLQEAELKKQQQLQQLVDLQEESSEESEHLASIKSIDEELNKQQ